MKTVLVRATSSAGSGGRVAGALLLVALALVDVTVASQNPAPAPATASDRPPRDPVSGRRAGTSVVRGRVTRAGDGQPLRNVRLELAPSADTSGAVFSDADGRFMFDRLPAGRYRLSAYKGGYVAVQQGQSWADGSESPQISVADGQVIDLVDLALVKAAVISGQVVDERGDEVSGAAVMLMRQTWDQGYSYLRSMASLEDRSDDRGEFRLFDVPAGSYVLGVFVNDPSGRGPIGAYYPGTYSTTDALSILVRPGQELGGMNVPLVRTRRGSISGTVRRMDGRPLAGESVSVFPAQGQSVIISRETEVRPDGTYVVEGLQPGEYWVRASSTQSTSDGLWSWAPRVVVDGANVSVPLTLRRGDTMRGRFVFEWGPPSTLPAPPTSVSTSGGAKALVQSELFSQSASGTVTIGEGWTTFEATGLNGRYRIGTRAPTGWHIKRVLLRGSDITDGFMEFAGADVDGVEIVLTQQDSRLAGQLLGVANGTKPNVTVILFAEDERKLGSGSRYVSSAPSSADGRYELRALRPARYLAAAVAGILPDQTTNPELLKRLRQVATRVDVREGESASLDLTVREIR